MYAFIIKLILFLIGCGLTALSICIKFDVIKIKKYEDETKIQEKHDMVYYLLIVGFFFNLLLLLWVLIEQATEVSVKYVGDKYQGAKGYVGDKYQGAKGYVGDKYQGAIGYVGDKYQGANLNQPVIDNPRGGSMSRRRGYRYNF
jgi:hypothetical protein